MQIKARSYNPTNPTTASTQRKSAGELETREKPSTQETFVESSTADPTLDASKALQKLRSENTRNSVLFLGAMVAGAGLAVLANAPGIGLGIGVMAAGGVLRLLDSGDGSLNRRQS